MTERVAFLFDGKLLRREMPSPRAEVVPGVKWGRPTDVFTPAYWLLQSWMTAADSAATNPYKTKDGILSEIVFCLLGGYGITAELATAAYKACLATDLVASRSTSEDAWRRVLSSPLRVGSKQARYRFPNKKSGQLASAMASLSQMNLKTSDDLKLREKLLGIPGVGYKTSSWIVRNVLDSDRVAILDVHIQRAGLLCGLFEISEQVPSDYLAMERKFLRFSNAMGVRPSILDCIIWEDMRAAGPLPLRLLSDHRPIEIPKRRMLTAAA